MSKKYIYFQHKSLELQTKRGKFWNDERFPHEIFHVSDIPEVISKLQIFYYNYDATIFDILI